MKLELTSDYLKKINKQTNTRKNKLENNNPKKLPVYFKQNALNGGDIDWSRTLAYSNAPL